MFARFRPVLVLLFGAMVSAAQSLPPRIFYSDLESGPNTGGENNQGAYVTIWGKGFGATRGSSRVTVGGGNAANYPVWTDTKISFQLGSAAQTGNIVVITSAGSSNGLPFTVRSGNIYCVSPSGSDSNPGTFSGGCWRSLLKARDSMSSGDITYAREGVAQTSDDGQGWRSCMLLRAGGTADRPKAFVVYPGETATIGNASSVDYGVRSNGNPYWVIAGFQLRGRIGAMAMGDSYRIVGNELQCPNGDGADACAEAPGGNNIKFYGNEVHNAGRSSASKMYHAVYFSTNSNHIDVGWNYIHDNQACRAIQFHSSGGSNQYDLLVHDNLIVNSRCDAINLATVDPSKGPVRVYNNVVRNAGKGPHPGDGMANYACLYFPGGANSGSVGSGTIEVFNNTFHSCGYPGSGANGGNGAIVIGGNSPNTTVQLRNNIIWQTDNLPYLYFWSNGPVSGSNNIFYGNGNGPSQTSGNINADPKVVNATGVNYQLQSSSPAIDAGFSIASLETDINGVGRPQGSGFDIGAYEYPNGGSQQFSSCDVNRDGVVNSTDSSLILSQALGQASCSADLNGDGQCTVVEVQRIVNAVNGMSCRTGT